MKELVIISGKGGTGKTSITAALAHLAENVVVADCDVDAADLHLLLQPVIRQQQPFIGGKRAQIQLSGCTACGRCRQVCRFDAIDRDYRVDALACEGCGVCVWNCPEQVILFNECISGEWFLSETRCGPMVHARLGIAQENSGKLVALVRQQARQVAEEKKADWLLVDGPPGTGCPVIASIGGADGVLVVTEPTVSAVHDLKRVVNLAAHFQVPAMICINKCDINRPLTNHVIDYCREKRLPVVGTLSYSRAMTTTHVQGTSIWQGTDETIKKEIRQMWQKIRSYP